MNEEKQTFGDYLRGKYGEWVADQSKKKDGKGKYTMGDFSENHLHISKTLFSQYVHNVRLPKRRAVYALAIALGPEVYEKLDMNPPKPEIKELTANWDGLSDEAKRKIIEIIRADKDK